MKQAIGFAAAVEALRQDRALEGAAVYIGDAMADFHAVQRAAERGLDVTYGHVRSGATSEVQERRIACWSRTRCVVSTLTEMVPYLAAVPT